MLGRPLAAVAVLLMMAAALAARAAEPPTSWVDPDTGHRVLRLSREPGSSSLYFNFNGYTPDGRRLAISTPHGIATIELATGQITPLVNDRVHLLFVGHRTGDVYYSKAADPGAAEGGMGRRIIYAANIATGRSREVARVNGGDPQTINADETLIGAVRTLSDATVRHDGTLVRRPQASLPARDPRTDQPAYQAVGPDGKPLPFAEAKESRLDQRLEAKIPMQIFTVDLRNGAERVVYGSTDWLNHLQFSPTDPGLLMFCHEGPWHKVDRLWIVRTDRPGAQPTKIHTRTMNMEIAGHEWFSADGKTIWYDLQTPRGQDFWVAGYELATGKRTWHHLERNWWSVHFNSSPDGRLFAGDGGDAEMVAHAPDGKWIYLFRPNPIPDVAGIRAPNAEQLIHPGYFTAERLVNMKNHDYRLEPNVNFEPNGKWIVFRSNMFGPSQVFAVEVAKAR